jgi:hypothetical protein
MGAILIFTEWFFNLWPLSMFEFTAWQQFWILFSLFWVGVLIWFKGTDPLSSLIWVILWRILLVISIVGIAILFLAWLCSMDDE